MDFLFLTAKVNKQLKIIHHNFSLHNTNKVNEKALHEETHFNWILQFIFKRNHSRNTESNDQT